MSIKQRVDETLDILGWVGAIIYVLALACWQWVFHPTYLVEVHSKRTGEVWFLKPDGSWTHNHWDAQVFTSRLECERAATYCRRDNAKAVKQGILRRDLC
ncbi:hypothetical protein MYOV003v1_p0033 [Vibrio phage 207E48.1]|nr:hypothetical protein MYOV003v1_p0033 [Vibrio phage 207E48.1]